MLIDCKEALIVRCIVCIVTVSISIRGVIDTIYHWSAVSWTPPTTGQTCNQLWVSLFRFKKKMQNEAKKMRKQTLSWQEEAKLSKTK
jgi:hypothetical protein